MNNFTIKQGEDLPGVLINFDQGIIELVGKSLPEDSLTFYNPIEAAVKDYISNPQPTTTINLRLEYLNSSSQKRILEILSLFEAIVERGLQVEINWYFNQDDEDILEEGKDLAKTLTLPINFISE
jgi:hypothetical protein